MMSTALQFGEGAWAKNEFCDCVLGDKRRTDRLVEIASELSKQSHGVLPKTFEDWGDLKGAYRFMNSKKIAPQAIQRPHFEHIQTACIERGTYLLIEDTTDLNFTRPQEVRGIGWTGNEDERGFLVHST